jgi:hypothetical protein
MGFKSIRTRLNFWFICVALVPILIAVYVGYSQRVDSIKREAFSKLIAIRELKVAQLKSWLKHQKTEVSELANLVEIINLNQWHQTPKKKNLIEQAR